MQLSLTLLTLALALFPSALADRTFIINNACPSDVSLFMDGVRQSILAPGAVVTKTFPSNFSGAIYSTSNGGSGTGRFATTAWFQFESGYYYIVKDELNFNMGVAIAPHAAASNGFCPQLSCDSSDCTGVFLLPQQPLVFPPPGNSPPSPPLFECPGTNTGFTVRFCPTQAFPTDGRLLHPSSDRNKCLDVRGNVQSNGTPVQIYDCNGSPAQSWVIHPGSTNVQLKGTNFCLDAGSSPGNGVGMKVWQCFDNLPAQQWFFTDDNRIALENQGLCLDLTNGNLTNGNQVQTWQCTDNNNNQAWFFL
ncbi:Carbohydrate-binding module family 13 protein [Pleurotus pulmonarius]